MFNKKKVYKVENKNKGFSYDLRCVINGEIAIKPYYYLRNGLLHVRFNVDRCIKLSLDEEKRIKDELEMCPQNKQEILGRNWNFLTLTSERKIIKDGIKAGDERIKELSRKYENDKYCYGHKN